ncbi:regulatory protein, Fis family [Nannocystis exedens]|uniref:Regulatory protein, Fis family n=1 Tax=Nannocystis exedens TaxID=54 RepID=A0A1I2FUH0_9BACT|nr:helix-turn-helix domain-containing protein [Nannocystis exedens]PCC73755.1 Bacterial regulatory protein, Fis family [Nannocystis exedens]SFF09062.1 regulatory protein, Fis family [Nannocystis exedens]
MAQLILDDFNLEKAERRLCTEALSTAGNIVGAAALLGITRHALKRRIIKLAIEWPPRPANRPSDAAHASAGLAR